MTDVDQIVVRIEELLSESDARAEELVRMLMQLYGAGLERMVEILGDSEYAERFADDKLIGSLLLLHGLHPLDAETRVRRMLAKLEQSFGAHFSLEGMERDVARVRVEKNGSPLPGGIGEVIERAALEVAPDLAGVKVEGLPAEPLVQIER
ncbi:MAG: hypothetical protein LAO79_11190 [Acidobacteriia bacterium]|nr:hypothetical protein [Terriglobia bacterium]